MLNKNCVLQVQHWKRSKDPSLLDRMCLTCCYLIRESTRTGPTHTNVPVQSSVMPQCLPHNHQFQWQPPLHTQPPIEKSRLFFSLWREVNWSYADDLSPAFAIHGTHLCSAPKSVLPAQQRLAGRFAEQLECTVHAGSVVKSQLCQLRVLEGSEESCSFSRWNSMVQSHTAVSYQSTHKTQKICQLFT